MAQDSDEHLIRYLLGELPDSEAEGLDERSMTDDAFAERLRLLEDDLVDRYARGDATGVPRARFDQARRASPYLRQKVRFAEALHVWTGKELESRTDSVSAWRKWALAAAAVALVATTGYLALMNQRLRSEVAQQATRKTAVEQRNAELQRQLERAPVAGTTPSAPITATFVLRPPRRGPESEAAVAVRKDATQVAFRLEVESDAYPRFWAALKDVATGAIAWRSPDVDAEPAGANRIATIVVPASILRSQRYVIELSGASKSGTWELLGAYPLRITVE
jgi:hypothetical protein